MSVTATRLGKTGIVFDWSALPRLSKNETQKYEATWETLSARFKSNEVAFYNAPIENEVSQLEESLTLAEKIISSGKFKDVLCLGIGGSSLGPISLLSALKHKVSSGLRIQFIENPDPEDWQHQLAKLDPATTLILPIAKSGTTFETLAQLLLSLEWLGEARWKSQVVAITDPKKGDLRKFADQLGCPTLPIHPGVGGRFSLFTPVGLFVGALAGYDMRAFVEGSKKVRELCEKSAEKKELQKNPLFLLGPELIALYPQKKIHTILPYSTELKSLGAWFVQLWAESLGKGGKGFTPLSALGAVDQHSILQLMRDGPDDKITFFFQISETEKDVKIPTLRKMATGSMSTLDLPAFQILGNTTLHQLLRIEKEAISKVLTNQGRAHLTIQLDALNEENLGALYFSLCVLTAFTGTFWGMDPFDQPGVEEGKVYIRDSLLNQDSIQKTDDRESAYDRLRTYGSQKESKLEE
jgi:glucose-6-phosphate isomerase